MATASAFGLFTGPAPLRGTTFTPEGQPKSVTGKQVSNIRYGLGAVKGAGQSAIENIIAARKSGPARTRTCRVAGAPRLRSTRC